MALVNKQAQVKKRRAKQAPKYRCRECGSPNLIHQAGCDTCLDCGWNACLEG